MGLVLLIIIWLITLVSTYFFVAKTWWLPVGAAAAAPGIDHHFTVTFILMGVVFVAAQLALGYLVWLYRDRGSSSTKVAYSHGNTTMEIAWTVLTTILFVGMNLASSSIWASERRHAQFPGLKPKAGSWLRSHRVGLVLSRIRFGNTGRTRRCTS